MANSPYEPTLMAEIFQRLKTRPWLRSNPNTMVFRFEDSEVTPTYEEMCAVMDYHLEQDETSALPSGPRYDLAEIVALCPVYLPDGINKDQGLPLEPFLNRSMAYFLDRISRQYGIIQRVPRIHNFESGLMTPHLLTNLADRWQNRNTCQLVLYPMMILGSVKIGLC
ncbi:hypothetical protein JCGZ_26550 [Jatropha curcas]|uniref:Aminotransferase-like plant mobile domain-containing protein n=1 Tax=Jatropha curcas TaxID=180498 RepID=A0A067JKA5_JATCU|nr:hypothetical protein JCGZ_26550 [Jatropha curcas]